MDVNFEDMNPIERAAAFRELLRLQVGAIKLDGENDWCVGIESEKPVAPDECVAVQASPLIDFWPRKLVILEPPTVVEEHETIYGDIERVVPAKSWWSRPTTRTERVAEKVFTHKRLIPTLRGMWKIVGVYFGNRAQFPTHAGIGGDEFGPLGEFVFSQQCEAGLYITVQVKNMAKIPATFSAVLIGSQEQPKAT